MLSRAFGCMHEMDGVNMGIGTTTVIRAASPTAMLLSVWSLL